MPSESFYVAMGILGVLSIITSVVFNIGNLDYEGTRTLRFLAPIAFTIGIIFFISLGVAGYFDLRPRFRRWNLKRKSRDIELEKQEREFERRKREFETKHPKENQTRSESSPPTVPYQKQTKDTPSQKSGVLPKQTTKPMEIKQNQPILEKGKPVSEKLKQNAENSEIIVEKQANTHVPATYTDEDFEHAISLSKHLQCLWKLLNTPSHNFPNKNQLIIAIKGNDSNRTPYYDAIDELEEKGLVYIGEQPYSDLMRSKGSVEITEAGIILIQRARKEKVTSWHEAIMRFENQKMETDDNTTEISDRQFELKLTEEKESGSSVAATSVKKTECSLELKNALYHLVGKDFRKAIEAYDQILKKEPSNIDALVGKANSYHSLGKYDDALSSYTKALEIEPNNESAKIGKARLLAQYDNNNEAKKLVEKGISYFLLNDYGLAAEYYDNALALDPSNIRGLICKADVLFKVKPEDAIYWYDVALEIDPKNVTTLVKKAVAVQNLRSQHEAEMILDNALEIDPNHVGALVCKANIIGEEDNDKALALLDKALSIDPHDAFALESRELARQIKRTQDKMSDLKKQLDK